ncbi:MAG: hypothetical protein ACRDH6_00855 [Actinomycetota bacterium]
MTESDLKVIYIMGPARSGSTLLGMLLGELDGFFNAGELSTLWRLQPADRCGCGEPHESCVVWSKLLHDRSVVSSFLRTLLEGGGTGVGRAARLRQTLRFRPGQPTGLPELDERVGLLNALYRGITDETGARVIVDDAKFSLGAAHLRLMAGFSVGVVHLVRDPRAVAYSMQWKEGGAIVGPFTGWGAGRSTRMWLQSAVSGTLVRRAYGANRSLLLRYEDFVANPSRWLTEIARLVGESPARLPLVNHHVARFRLQHTVDGNPHRFKTGDVEIVDRREWLLKMTGPDRALVTAQTLPFLVRYGYPIWPRG